MEKPEDFDVNASIEEQIAQLKRDGKNYNNDSLENLLSIINAIILSILIYVQLFLIIPKDSGI